MKEVDVKKIFYDKNPKAARWIPNLVFRYLKKIAHQDYINTIIRNYGHLKNFEFSEKMIEYFNVTVKTKGEENLPDNGRFIFASNHPLGGFDGQIIMYLIGKKYGKNNYKFLVNDILMNLTNMEDVFLPVNKHGKQGSKLAVELDNAFKSDKQILTFPAGIVSRKIAGLIMDLPWQKSFISKAVQYQRDIIPIHISGKNSKFFYRLNLIRKKLGIKANLEMLYLIDETYKHRNKHFTVSFEKPIPWQTFDKTRKPIEWAKYVKEKVYLMDGINEVPL